MANRRIGAWLAIALIASLTAAGQARAAPAGCEEKVQRTGRGFSVIAMPPGKWITPLPWDEPKALYFGVDPADPNRMFSANTATVQRTDDGGCTWKEVFRLPLLTSGAPTIPCDGALWAGSSQFWQPGCAYIGDLDVATGLDGTKRIYVQVWTAWVTTLTLPPWLQSGWTSWIYRSDDGGETFELLLHPTSPDGTDSAKGAGELFVAPSDPSTLYLIRQDDWATGLASGTRLYVSRDAGDTWVKRPLPALTGLNPMSFVIHPTDPGQVWVQHGQIGAGQSLTSNQLMRTTNYAESWEKIDTPAAMINQLAIAPNGDETEAAILSESKLFLSEDTGRSWREATLTRPATYLRYGKSHRYLFLIDEDTYIGRLDTARDILSDIKTDAWGDYSTQWKPQYVAGSGLYFLSSCGSQKNGTPFSADSCGWLTRYTGRGT